MSVLKAVLVLQSPDANTTINTVGTSTRTTSISSTQPTTTETPSSPSSVVTSTSVICKVCDLTTDDLTDPTQILYCEACGYLGLATEDTANKIVPQEDTTTLERLHLRHFLALCLQSNTQHLGSILASFCPTNATRNRVVSEFEKWYRREKEPYVCVLFVLLSIECYYFRFVGC